MSLHDNVILDVLPPVKLLAPKKRRMFIVLNRATTVSISRLVSVRDRSGDKYQFRGCDRVGTDSLGLHGDVLFHIFPPIKVVAHSSLYSVVVVSNWSFERIDQLKEGRSTIIVSKKDGIRVKIDG